MTEPVVPEQENRPDVEQLAAQWRNRARDYRDQMDFMLPNRAGQAERDSLVWRARAYETCAEELQLALNVAHHALPAPEPPADELLTRVRRALWDYGQHKSFCHYVRPKYNGDIESDVGTPCDCGLHVEMEASRGAAPAPPDPKEPSL